MPRVKHVTSADIDDRTAAVVECITGHLDELAEPLATAIQDVGPAYCGGVYLSRDEVVGVCRHMLELACRYLTGERERALEDARCSARERARRGIPLESVLRAYRVGGRFMCGVLLKAADDGRERAGAMRAAASVTWSVVDDFSEAFVTGYRRGVAERAAEHDAAQELALDRLLAGEITEAAVARSCAQRLRLPTSGRFVVVHAEAVPAHQVPLARLADRLRRRGVLSTWCTRTDASVGIVALGTRWGMAELADELEQQAEGRIGVSESYPALESTGDAAAQAAIAASAAPPGEAVVVRHDMAVVPVLLASATDAAARLARHTLGALLGGESDDGRVLLATLRSWASSGGSASEAARSLHCHPNTVRYRLRRIEQLTGRSLSDPMDLMHVLLASQALDVVPVVSA